GLIVPFLNVGYIVENSEDWDDRLENTEVNLGLDVVLQEDFGFTVGYERRSSNEKQDDGSATDAIDTAYISAKKSLDYAEVGLAYWWYDHNVEQGQDNVSSSVTLEVALAF
ncbi:MAG: hypothetical protein MI864_19650, partial [Pseudomonadales bacterium]|nr:hypothetical protein [Pseudomonadales bacterium]